MNDPVDLKEDSSRMIHSLLQYRAKWGTDPERADECKDVEVDALTDRVRLRQQPFEGHKPLHTRRLSAWSAEQV